MSEPAARDTATPSLLKRIVIDYLAALVVVIATIIIGLVVARALDLEVKFFPIPLWALWWLFLLELFNICRILYEERRNLSGIPLIKVKTAVFLFYPILSGCWILSPWVIFQHNKIAANLAISAYDHYWVKQRDVDRAFDSAMILYYCTREATFLHAIPDGLIRGDESTQAKARTWFMRVLSKDMNLDRLRLPEVQSFMIQPLRKAASERSSGDDVHRRITAFYRNLVASDSVDKLVEFVPRAAFFRKIREEVAPGT